MSFVNQHFSGIYKGIYSIILLSTQREDRSVRDFYFGLDGRLGDLWGVFLPTQNLSTLSKETILAGNEYPPQTRSRLLPLLALQRCPGQSQQTFHCDSHLERFNPVEGRTNNNCLLGIQE